MNLDKQKLNLIMRLCIFQISSFILFLILWIVGITTSSTSGFSSVSSIFGYLFLILCFVLDIVTSVKIMTQNWNSKWCLKHNVTFAILGLFFGCLIFFIFSGVGKVKIKQEILSDVLTTKI